MAMKGTPVTVKIGKGKDAISITVDPEWEVLNTSKRYESKVVGGRVQIKYATTEWKDFADVVCGARDSIHIGDKRDYRAANLRPADEATWQRMKESEAILRARAG